MWQFTIITVYGLALLWAGVKIREVTPRTIKNHRKYYKTATGVLCVGLIGFIFTMNSNFSGVNDTYTIIFALSSCWFLEFSSSPDGLNIARKEEGEQFEVVGLSADNSPRRLVQIAASM